MADPYLLLFVSHVSEDRPTALEIVDELERRGVPCWIAPRDVRPGRPFDDEIAEAIEASRAMLLIFSERCNENEYIRREITVAGESHKVIIPFRIENAQPRRGLRIRLSDLHWIDGFVSRERAIGQVVRTIDPDRARRQEEEHKAHEEKRRRDEEEHRFQQEVEEQRLRQEQEEQRRRQEEEEHRRCEEQQRRLKQKAEGAQHSPKSEKEKHRAQAPRQVSEISSDQLPPFLKIRSQITLSVLSITLKFLVLSLDLILDPRR
jgi:TIR domain